jgi:hypothetical protein
MLEKRVLRPDRLRSIPQTGFSWIDRRFVREFAPTLTSPQILLYYFLVSVADVRGLSFWSDPTASRLLGMSVGILVGARDVLIARDLIAYRRPLYQVLSLPGSGTASLPIERPRPPAAGPSAAPPPPRAAYRRGQTLSGRALFVQALAELRPEVAAAR